MPINGVTMASNNTAFKELGFKKTFDSLLEEIREIYLADSIPWVVGYSGGKDSTAVLQLVWIAVSHLKSDQLTKPIHVISTDTFVENPVVAGWVDKSLDLIKNAAIKKNLPIYAHRLTPKLNDTFWVNLIGRGYPAPRPKFRWCTDRLKIAPSNNFIRNVVQESGEAILVLGTRKAESTARAKNMARYEKGRLRDRLSPNAGLPNSLVYTPIENWTNDDVWLFLMQVPNPWGYNNKDLLTMYQGATEGGECPLVIDSSTPSCGDSRFGCWVCTLVDKDKSMQAMIQNDEEKEWMLPLLELRNELDLPDDRHLRDFRRMSGKVQLFYDRPIPGPYKQSIREKWLKKLLEAREWIRKNGPEEVRDIELITLEELHEIRRIWVVDKHEIEDTLPKVYEDATGKPFPGQRFDDTRTFGASELNILKDICRKDELHYELIRELLDVEQRFCKMSKRSGLYDALEQAFKRNFYDDEEDAVQRERNRDKALKNKSDESQTAIENIRQGLL